MDINKIFETLDQIYAGKESYKAEGYLKECLEEAKTERDAGAQMIICAPASRSVFASSRHSFR